MAGWHPQAEWIQQREIRSYVCDWDVIKECETKVEKAMMVLAKEDKTQQHFVEFFKMETGHESATQGQILTTLSTLRGNMASISESADVNAVSPALKCSTSWDAEGETSNPDGWKCMGEQAAKAYFLLQVSAERNETLTVPLIKCVHRILMSGAMKDCGEFRKESAMAADYVFALHTDIESGMEAIVAKFENHVKSANCYAVAVAAQLMLDFVTIHPFNNGNGRLCRLLFSYALQRMNFPFPVTLDSGYSKSYKHYVNALKQAQTLSKKGALLQLALLSTTATLTNYAKFSTNLPLRNILIPGDVDP